jgi:hypothetical protein
MEEKRKLKNSEFLSIPIHFVSIIPLKLTMLSVRGIDVVFKIEKMSENLAMSFVIFELQILEICHQQMNTLEILLD